MDATDAKFGIALGVAAAALFVSIMNAIYDGGAFSRLGDWLSALFRRRGNWDECPRLHAARQFLGAKLLAGGYGKHHAYCIAGDGGVLAADALDFYLALFAGVEDFWHLVALAERHQPGSRLLSRPAEEIGLDDGERRYARIHYGGGITYVDSVAVGNLPYAYHCTWATAGEFKYAIEDAKRQASARREVKDDVEGAAFHGGDYSTPAP